MTVYIGLDIGGTKLMAAAADREGNILRRARTPTSTSLKEDLQSLNRMISDLSAGEKILGMGAAVGGPLDCVQGVVSPLHQPAWREVPLKTIMENQWGCPFSVDVDTNVAAMGEYYLGHVTADRFLYITISTGMGGGFLIDGRIYRGAAGSHPEIGHQSIPYRCLYPENIHCECGAPDCLEALISGNGIRRVYGKPAEHLDSIEWDEVAFNLGQGLRNLATIYAPGEICLGGGVALGGGEALLRIARQVMEEHLRLVDAPVVRLSSLGYDTALLGAVMVAMRGLI